MLARHWTRPLVQGLTQRKLQVAHACGPNTSSLFSTSAVLLYIKKPRNHKIKAQTVQLVDQENKLRPPEPLEDILSKIDFRTHFVELVQENPPIVKIGDKEVERAARKAAKMKDRVSKMERKEVQMTWNVSDSDLEHKIKKAREQLERNNLVDFAFAPKAKQRLPPVKAMEEKMEKVVDALQDIAIERQDRTLDRGVGVTYLRLNSSKVAEAE